MQRKQENVLSHQLSGRPRRWTSEELFQGGREILIVHGKNEYRLIMTRAGKLILNK